MNNNNLNIASKKAVIFFTNNASSKIFGNHKVSSKRLINIFNKQILCLLHEAKSKTDFDLIISSDNSTFDELSKIDSHKGKKFFLQQKGKCFGEKFNNSIKSAFELGYKEIVAIGNDSPDLTTEIIISSFEKLREKNSVIVGPANDGGFYLIGLNYFDDKIFQNIKWQTSKVFNQLRRNIISLNKNVLLLPRLRDIDDQKSFIKWLSLKTKISKIINELLKQSVKFQSQCKLLTPFYNKELYLAKRISQKSPPCPV